MSKCQTRRKPRKSTKPFLPAQIAPELYVIQVTELISDLGITAPLIASAGICNHPTLTVVIMGMLDIG
jgi:hypothetical protein